MRMHSVFVAFFLAFLLISQDSHATVTVHDWQKDYRGYSICQVPNTGPGTGNPEEFMLAGTIISPSVPGAHGFHILKVDANGSVLSTNTQWPILNQSGYGQANWSYSVVDIVPEDNGSGDFWVTALARYTRLGEEVDYILIEKVSASGFFYFFTSEAEVLIRSSFPDDHKNLYPTHSVFYDNSLYVCGYFGDNTQSTNDPLNNLSSKKGIVIRFDFNNLVPNPSLNNELEPTITSIGWNTPSTGNDYDMPLRMLLFDESSQKRIAVTGAANSHDCPGCPSGALAMILKPDLSVVGTTDVVPISHSFATVDGHPHGVYGVDIVINDNNFDCARYSILVNAFDNDDPVAWGVISLPTSLTTVGLAQNSYLQVNNVNKMWANQFFVEDYPSCSSEIRVIGQQYDACESAKSSISAPSLIPSVTNVNPFWAKLSVSLFPLTVNTIIGPTVHLSKYGTFAPNLDYLNGPSSIVGSSIYDVKRLYTGATTINNDVNGDIVMVNPIVNQSNTYLSTKITRINSAGNETVCNNQVKDCSVISYSPTESGAQFDFFYNEVDNTFNTYVAPHWNTNYSFPNEYDCSNGYYRPGRNVETTRIKAANSSKQLIGKGLLSQKIILDNDVNIYPNPATDKLKVTFKNTIENGDKVLFTLTDVTGKNVLTIKELGIHGQSALIQLPNLNAGVYFCTILYNDIRAVKKVIVQ